MRILIAIYISDSVTVCVCHGVHARDSAAEREKMEREPILSEKIMGYTLRKSGFKGLSLEFYPKYPSRVICLSTLKIQSN